MNCHQLRLVHAARVCIENVLRVPIALEEIGSDRCIPGKKQRNGSLPPRCTPTSNAHVLYAAALDAGSRERLSICSNRGLDWNSPSGALSTSPAVRSNQLRLFIKRAYRIEQLARCTSSDLPNTDSPMTASTSSSCRQSLMSCAQRSLHCQATRGWTTKALLLPLRKSARSWAGLWRQGECRHPQIMNLIGFSVLNHPFWGTPIFGITQDFFRSVISKMKNQHHQASTDGCLVGFVRINGEDGSMGYNYNLLNTWGMLGV